MVSPLNDPLASLALPQAETERKELGQAEFLKLMTTQLKNQDPFKPLESGDFLGQLAQFGTVAGLSELKSSFGDLAGSLVSNQALQGASLVGRDVLVEGDTAQLAGGGTVRGALELPAGSSTVRVQITAPDGRVVRQIELGAHAAGRAEFSWSGETDSGVDADAGTYRISAQYFNGSDMQSVPVLLEARVESVSLGPGGLRVRLDGGREVPFSSVRQIG